MVSIDQLRRADPGLYLTMPGVFQRRAADVESRNHEFNTQVVQRIGQDSAWSGPAARAAMPYVERVIKEGRRVADDLDRIAGLIEPIGHRIAAAKQKLLDAETQAGAAGLTVHPDGAVSWPPGLDEAAVETASRTSQLVADQIAGALREATDADQELTRAPLVVELEHMESSQQTVADQIRSEQAGRKAAGLATNIGKLSSEQIKELAGLLERGRADPFFSTAFHEQLGAQGTLQFGVNLAARGHGAASGMEAGLDGAEGDEFQLRRMQDALGQTLATATDERGDVHVSQAWEDQLLDAGDERFALAPPNQYYSPYGHQILGSLMHSGEYSPEFLNQAGESMLGFDRENPGAWRDVQLNAGPEPVPLHIGGDQGGGFDPLSGLTNALSRNPEAAVQFFDPVTHPDRLGYLLTEREWLPDHPDGPSHLPPDYQSPGLRNLGLALESATLDAGPSQQAASIASMTVHELAGSDVPPELRGSVANVIGGYIGDVNDAVALDPVPDAESERSANAEKQPLDRLFRDWNDAAISAPDQFGARFRTHEVFDVMASVAQDPDAFATLYDAERAYGALAANHVASVPGNDPAELRQNVVAQAGTASQVLGSLDQARADSIDATAADYQAAIEQRGALSNIALGNLVGGWTADMGSLGIDSLVDAGVEASQDQANVEKAVLYDNGRGQAADVAFTAMWNNALWDPDNPPPASLLTADGRPADLSTLSSQQWADLQKYFGDKNNPSSLLPALQQVDGSYSGGRIHQQERGGG